MHSPPTKDELFSRCRQAGLALTPQRSKLLETLAERCDHPTAESLVGDVTAAMPGVSRVTVYRSLETLAQAGVIQRVPHSGGTFRYDARTEHHHHLVCDQCGGIFDWQASTDEHIVVPTVAQAGFVVKSATVVFRGTCQVCSKPRAATGRTTNKRRRSREKSKNR